MKLLLDENTPVQLQPVLQQVLDGDHVVDHVLDIEWASKKDKHLIPDAGTRGYHVLITRDSRQLEDPEESRLLKRVGIHHVRFAQGEGRKGLARAVGSVISSMIDVVEDLEAADGQRLVHITGIAGGKRHTTVDPKVDPPPYWR